MKKYIFLFLILGGLAMPFTGAAQSTDSLLCRTWQVDFTQTLQLLSTEDQQAFNAFPEAQKNLIMDFFGNIQVQFQANGTLIIDNETSLQGNWSWTNPGQSIQWQAGGVTYTKTIEQLDGQNLILRNEGSLEEVGMFPRIFLIPVTN